MWVFSIGNIERWFFRLMFLLVVLKFSGRCRNFFWFRLVFFMVFLLEKGFDVFYFFKFISIVCFKVCGFFFFGFLDVFRLFGRFGD